MLNQLKVDDVVAVVESEHVERSLDHVDGQAVVGAAGRVGWDEGLGRLG